MKTEKNKLVHLQNSVLFFLADLYEEKYKTEEFDTETVEKFKHWIEVDMISKDLLIDLDIKSTKELQEALLSH